jgi:sulfide:quinone oxidoreductase
MPRQRIVIVGSSFAGFTAAMELAKRLDGRHDMVLISDRERFIFIPSLIWVPFGRRTIRFLHAAATRFDPAQRVVETMAGPQTYDYLLIATGPKPDHDMLPGLGPERGYRVSVCTLEHVEAAAHAWRDRWPIPARWSSAPHRKLPASGRPMSSCSMCGTSSPARGWRSAAR